VLPLAAAVAPDRGPCSEVDAVGDAGGDEDRPVRDNDAQTNMPSPSRTGCCSPNDRRMCKSSPLASFYLLGKRLQLADRGRYVRG
jgi:hypothetical protein